jgi:hypothetical protein
MAMNTERSDQQHQSADQKNERGAALVTVLLLSFLLLAGVTAVVLESSLNTANVTDATSEEQAYYAAESGIQSVVDALRHNPLPSPLIDPSKTPLPPDPDADPANQIDYLKAVRIATSNATNPSSTACASSNPPLDCQPRLSRWLRYDTTFPDRIILGDPATYSPINGFAFSVRVSDPDNTGGTVSYTMSGGFEPATPGTLVPARTFGTAPNTTTITYTPPVGSQTVDVSSGIGNGNIGSFTITTTGTGGTIPSGDQLPRFKLTMNVTQPQNSYVIIRGYAVPAGSDLQGSPNCPRPVTSYLFDSQNFYQFGSRTQVTNTGCMVEQTSSASGPYGTYLAGWLVNSVGGTQSLSVSITAPEPTRLLIRSTGFGPRGARKELESIIQKNYFNGLGAPSPLTLIGPPCTKVIPILGDNCVPRTTVTDFLMDPGNSSVIIYTGKDQKLKAFLPPIGLTNTPNMLETMTAVSSFNGKVFGAVTNVADELPHWLQTPRNLDQTVQLLRQAAQASGTYWGPTSSPPTSGVYGDWSNATGITFVDRDVEISGAGGGILVVTGRLNFKGNYRFNGLVLITGRDGFLRNGGGNGVLAGNMVVAPYDSTSLACSPQTVNCYLAPRYEITGGGTSDLMYNSQNVTNGLSGLGNFVKGVAEK